MATSFPGGLDAFSNPTPTDELNNADPALRHSSQHGNANDAIEALETKVGANGVSYTFIPPSATAGTAINAAIAALPADGGMIVLGAGTHTLDVAVSINKEVIIQGVGSLATRVRFNGATIPNAFVMADTTQRKWVIKDLRIDSLTDGSGTAINAGYCVNSRFENLRIGSSAAGPNRGIVFGGVSNFYNHVEDCTAHVNGTAPVGYVFDNGANSNQITHCRTLTSSTGATGILITGNSHSILIEQADIEAGDFVAIDIAAGCHDITMVGCYIENCTIGLRIASGVESVRYLGGYISSSTTANIQDDGAVGLTIENSWVQFDPYSSLDRRGVVRSQVNGIDAPSCEWQPDDLSAIAWAFDPAAISNTHTTVSGTLYLIRLNIRYPKTITNILFGVTTAATAVTANQNFVALYNSAGTRVAVSTAGVLDGPIASTGIKSIALSSPYAAAAGMYWAAILLNAGGTQAVLARGQGASLTIPNMGLTAANFRFAVNGTGLTSTPASITPASNSITGAGTIWAGAS